jgi:hypothetical protein
MGAADLCWTSLSLHRQNMGAADLHWTSLRLTQIKGLEIKQCNERNIAK